MTDFDSTRESAWAAVMRPMPFARLWKFNAQQRHISAITAYI